MPESKDETIIIDNQTAVGAAIDETLGCQNFYLIEILI
jgi:hypothetical protein